LERRKRGGGGPSLIMTYTHSHLLRIQNYAQGKYNPGKSKESASPGAANSGWYNLLIGSVLGHYPEFIAALLLYTFVWPIEEAAEVELSWVLRVVGANWAMGMVWVGFWHWYTYVGPYAKVLSGRKYNQENQYEPEGKRVRMFSSSTGNLEREILYTSAGWIQSGLHQCLVMHLWAAGYFPHYTDVWSRPLWTLFHLYYVNNWRQIHFYWVHRAIHPWRKELPLVGDVGKFMYKNFHSLHHKSWNPGPWSGLSMHPVEHLFYYSCVYSVLLFTAHPLHFLYIKTHADISPIGGHDGISDPSAGSDYHWLHHHKFECNYGVPTPINFDKIFGTWLSYEEYLEDAARKK